MAALSDGHTAQGHAYHSALAAAAAGPVLGGAKALADVAQVDGVEGCILLVLISDVCTALDKHHIHRLAQLGKDAWARGGRHDRIVGRGV